MQLQLSKPLLVTIAVIIVGLSILGWYIGRPQGSIEFAIAPQEVTFTYNGEKQTIKNGQFIKVAPGTYSATFARDGFQTDTQTIVVENRKTNRVILALTPLTDSAKKLLADSPESQKVIKEYQSVQYKKLIDSLPLSGVNYAINACQSIKEPKAGNKAVCIVAKTEAGKTTAQKNLEQLGYNLDSLELYSGTDNMLTVIATDTYRIDYYPNTKIEGATKKPLFITPLNVAFVPATASFNQPLEDIKTAALKQLKNDGFPVNEFDIFYSNVYLSRYNPISNIPE
jgi:hypothetical protein